MPLYCFTQNIHCEREVAAAARAAETDARLREQPVLVQLSRFAAREGKIEGESERERGE